MQPETVYNPTTIADGPEGGGYLDSISQQGHGRRRCCTLTIGGWGGRTTASGATGGGAAAP